MKLYNCTKEQFLKFIKDNDLKSIPGEFFHSKYYIDNQGNKLAYMKTSSWNMNIIYKVADDKFENLETNNFIGNKIN